MRAVGHKADDRERLALDAFDFDPAIAASRALGRIRQFADDPLEAHLAIRFGPNRIKTRVRATGPLMR
jgi:hypothetical protein